MALHFKGSQVEFMGVQWLGGSVLDSRPRAAGSSVTSVTGLCP